MDITITSFVSIHQSFLFVFPGTSLQKQIKFALFFSAETTALQCHSLNVADIKRLDIARDRSFWILHIAIGLVKDALQIFVNYLST